MSKRTVATFPQIFKDLWAICQMGKLSIELPKGQAVHYRQQMYTLRKLFREEGRDDAIEMDNWVIEVQPLPDGKALLLGRKHAVATFVAEILEASFNEAAASQQQQQQQQSFNPISLTPSGIPMQSPQVLTQSQPQAAATPQDAMAKAREEMNKYFAKGKVSPSPEDNK